jgi:glycosyltransferase involved in cell wall biosynthesis/ribosomal protein S18 acetylase RimI-like enzyme
VTTTDISLALLLGPQLRAFRDAGYEVIGASAPGPYVAGLEADGIRHVPLVHATRSMAPLEDARALVELTRRFRELRPDVVHTHNPKPGVYGRLAARLAGVPAVVNTVHGLYALPDDPLPKRTVVYGLERIAASCSGVELVQNPEDVPVLRRLGIRPEKVQLLGNGVDLARFAPQAPPGGRSGRGAALREEWGVRAGDVVVGLVGRLVAEKGYREVFEAAAALRASHPHVRFVIVGPDEPDKADGLTAAERDQAAARARLLFLGARRDVEDCYAACDLYVLASWREGFPRSAMEAAAMGLPIVATDIRGCRQVVEHGRTGLLVPVRDPAALAGAIRELVDDEPRRRAMGEAARAKARREFDQQRQIDLTLAVYERLLARRGRPAPTAARALTAGPSPGAGPAAPGAGAASEVRIRLAGPADVAALARLHAERIVPSFLASLGPAFLRRLYRRVVLDPGAFAVVADRDGEVVGFVAGAVDTRRFYRAFVLRDGVVAGIVAAPRLVRAAPRALETLRYPAGSAAPTNGDAPAALPEAGLPAAGLPEAGLPAAGLPERGLPEGGLPEAEILSVAVAATEAGRGLGGRLTRAAVAELVGRGVDEVRVVTADDNADGLRLYRRAGFVPRARVEVHAGVPQQVLVWTAPDPEPTGPEPEPTARPEPEPTARPEPEPVA